MTPAGYPHEVRAWQEYQLAAFMRALARARALRDFVYARLVLGHARKYRDALRAEEPR